LLSCPNLLNCRDLFNRRFPNSSGDCPNSGSSLGHGKSISGAPPVPGRNACSTLGTR
ncbi:hypothetical protein U1Q18_010013, partial [Sarracenia purpurea var. burkii]